MGLQRTPPQRANAESQSEAEGSRPSGSGSGPGEVSQVSPTRAFQPRNPRVMRSPLAGSTTTRPEPPMYPEDTEHEREMEVEGDISTTPHTAPPAARAPVPAPAPTSQGDAFTTPLPKKRKSRHAEPSKSLEQEAAETFQDETNAAPSQFDKNAMYGKRYHLMMDTLELAVKTTGDKWTWKSFVECFPKFAAEHHDNLSDVFESERAALRRALLAESTQILDEWNYGPALRKIEDVVQEARADKTEGGRPDAWRADTTARTMSTAAILPSYDEAYARLREEYLGLHADVTRRYASIADKQARLLEYESTVSDGVVDLDKTIKLLEGFPGEDMAQWMEQIMPTLREART